MKRKKGAPNNGYRYPRTYQGAVYRLECDFQNGLEQADRYSMRKLPPFGAKPNRNPTPNGWLGQFPGNA
ncbi:hypothetical protein LU632_05655 [Erwinia tracheiphila]|uniref:hypothetical protein n=1 Tax=Erwinia tracheiphila TaxID=65700 RepID=UPI001F242304|nr:hypothetical protein [Erwinia tracheiphila]UIA93059.1 hypothetical protein LU632_05655 [Erwinia tracheiphila]